MERLKIAHVPYSLMLEGTKPYSLCENFLSEGTELVPAWKVFHSRMMNDEDSDFSHLLRCCDYLGIPDVRASLNKMLVLDYIIANEDRHYTNFGFIRSAETLKWYGTAPIFDSVTSLWHNALDTVEPRKCQPFAKTHEEQIKLVSDLRFFNIEALEGIEQEIITIFSKSHIINENRSKAIAKAVLDRATNIDI